MENLIAALGSNIKKNGKNWVARCPVHNDKDFAMSIKQLEDGSVLAHCHACGANGYDLYQALGLPLDGLFGGRSIDSNQIPQKILDEYREDKIFIKIYEAAIKNGETPKLQDKRRKKLADARIEGIENKWPNLLG